MKYNPGDLVWAFAAFEDGSDVPRGEHAGCILGLDERAAVLLKGTYCADGELYAVDVEGYPAPLDGAWLFCSTCCLRPRRDDYQQHEPVGTREDLGRAFQTECEGELV